MRFELNQKYPFVCIKFENAVRQCLNGLASAAFEPYRHKLLGIEVKMLTCVEHHKVPNEWDESQPPKLDCDGFIFLDEESGIRWANQYPYASYGQVSDVADRLVRRMLPEGTAYKDIPPDMFFQMELATYRVERLAGAIHDAQTLIPKVEAGIDVDKYIPLAEIKTNSQALAEFRDKLTAEIEKVAGRELVTRTVTYGQEKHVLDGCFRVQFVDEEDCSHMA